MCEVDSRTLTPVLDRLIAESNKRANLRSSSDVDSSPIAQRARSLEEISAVRRPTVEEVKRCFVPSMWRILQDDSLGTPLYAIYDGAAKASSLAADRDRWKDCNLEECRWLRRVFGLDGQEPWIDPVTEPDWSKAGWGNEGISGYIRRHGLDAACELAGV
ncbi:MAG: hypothetical protein AAF078_10195 [Planctomycetota bacterium]